MYGIRILMYGYGRDLFVLNTVPTNIIVYMNVKLKPKTFIYNYKVVAQYESSGKIGFSGVSQAGVIELLCPLHAIAPFIPCEAAVIFNRSAHPIV